MNKLLAANFSRLFQNKMFWIGTIFMALLGLGLPFMHYQTMLRDGYHISIDNGFFVGALFIGIVLSVFCSLFVGTEYSDGTIRNKMVVGQKRPVIYLSNLITCAATGIWMCAIGFLTYLCMGLLLLDGFELPAETVLLLVLCTLLLSVAFSSIFTLIAMLNQNKAVSAVICILGMFLLLFVGIYVDGRLQEPETFDSYTYVDDSGNLVTDEAEPNPNYLRGTKREIYEFLNDFLPGGQALQISNHSAQQPWLLMVYSGIIFAGTTGAGLLFFQKKDLK